MHQFLFAWTGSIFVWVFFIPADCLFCNFIRFSYCYSVFHICCSWGRGAQFLAGGGEGAPVLQFSGFLQLNKLGLGLGCSGPCGCSVSFVRRSVSGSTIVLEGIV